MIRIRAMILAAGVLLAVPVAASAFFPPIRKPAPVATPAATPTPSTSSPIKIQGTPDPVTPPVTVAATPEPGTLVSALIGLGLVAGYRRRQKRRELVTV